MGPILSETIITGVGVFASSPGWLRARLRKLDLRDARLKIPVLGKLAYKVRVGSVLRSRPSQRAASNCAAGLRRVCQKVALRKGAASGT